MEHYKNPFNEYFTNFFKYDFKEGAIGEVLQGTFQEAMHGQLHICTKFCPYLYTIMTNLSYKSRPYLSHLNLGKILKSKPTTLISFG